MPKIEWKSLDEMPENCQPLLQAYDELFGLHRTSNVVRQAIGEPNPIVIIQMDGRMTGGSLRALEEYAGCRVEVEALAPGFLLVLMFGNMQESPEPPAIYGGDGQETRFLFRPLKK